MSITYIDDNVKTLNLKTECFRSTRYILPREWIRMWASSHINYIFVYIFYPKFNLNSKFMKRFDWPCPENFIVKRVWYLWQSKIQNGHNRRTFFCSHGTLNGERNVRRFLEITNNLPPNCAQMITGRSLQRWHFYASMCITNSIWSKSQDLVFNHERHYYSDISSVII